jgi:hypothetical protein
VRRKPPPKAVSASAQAGQIWAVAGFCTVGDGGVAAGGGEFGDDAGVFLPS